MPILDNPKHELFAQGLAKGLLPEDAYEKAGYSPHRQNAHRLMTDDDIKGRVNELLGRAAERAEITVAKVLRELGKLGFANMLDYVRVTDQGDAFVDLSALDRDKAAAIAEVTVEDFKDGRGEDARDVRRIKFKLADKRAALVDIGKHLGMFVERAEVGNPGDFDDMTTEQKRERASALTRQLGITPRSVTAGSA